MPEMPTAREVSVHVADLAEDLLRRLATSDANVADGMSALALAGRVLCARVLEAIGQPIDKAHLADADRIRPILAAAARNTIHAEVILIDLCTSILAVTEHIRSTARRGVPDPEGPSLADFRNFRKGPREEA